MSNDAYKYKNEIDFIKSEFIKYYVDKGPENGILQGTKYAGAATHARNCLAALVKMLKPVRILEIGSMHYESSNAMADAMDEVWGQKEGNVDSFDIKKGGYTGDVHMVPKNIRVKPGYWYSFPTYNDPWKYNDPLVVYPEFKDMTHEQIREKNFAILSDRVDKNGGMYDLIFIDGDHSYEGAKEDFDMALRVSHKNTVIVIDNVWDIRLNEVRQFYDDLKTIKWDFEEWNDTHFKQNMVMDNAVSLTY